MVEHLTTNQGVVGSSPTVGAFLLDFKSREMNYIMGGDFRRIWKFELWYFTLFGICKYGNEKLQTKY